VPAAALLALAVALSLAAAAVARHSYTIVPEPVERADDEVRRMYEAWKSEHRHARPRGVVSSDDRLRLEVFRDNLRYIDAHNAEAEAGLHTFRLGLTPFADLTLEEYRGRVLGFRGRRGASAVSRVGSGGASYRHPRPRGGDLPDAIDWREFGAVTGVKNQEQCGAYSVPLLHTSSLLRTQLRTFF
jgi:cathepsin L